MAGRRACWAAWRLDKDRTEFERQLGQREPHEYGCGIGSNAKFGIDDVTQSPKTGYMHTDIHAYMHTYNR